MRETQLSAAPKLTIHRTFAASRERVFTAWTDVEMLRQWFPPEGRLTDVRWDPREGGSFRIAMIVSNGEEWAVRGVFSEVRAPERLAFTFRWEEDDPAEERDTFITVELLDKEQETEMIFTHEGLRDEASRDNHRGGWTMSFRHARSRARGVIRFGDGRARPVSAALPARQRRVLRDGVLDVLDRSGHPAAMHL